MTDDVLRTPPMTEAQARDWQGLGRKKPRPWEKYDAAWLARWDRIAKWSFRVAIASYTIAFLATIGGLVYG